jgi:hypothetical protein
MSLEIKNILRFSIGIGTLAFQTAPNAICQKTIARFPALGQTAVDPNEPDAMAIAAAKRSNREELG